MLVLEPMIKKMSHKIDRDVEGIFLSNLSSSHRMEGYRLNTEMEKLRG